MDTRVKPAHDAVGASRRGHEFAAGISSPYRLHCPGEAVTRVRSHISPGPYRSLRELSLAGSVDPVIWCPPTFVGNSGIECFNGVRGYALYLLLSIFRALPTPPHRPRPGA